MHKVKPAFTLAFFLSAFSKMECKEIKPKQKAVSHWAKEMEIGTKKARF